MALLQDRSLPLSMQSWLGLVLASLHLLPSCRASCTGETLFQVRSQLWNQQIYIWYIVHAVTPVISVMIPAGSDTYCNTCHIGSHMRCDIGCKCSCGTLDQHFTFAGLQVWLEFAHQSDQSVCFMDLRKAYDHVSMEVLWKTGEYGVLGTGYKLVLIRPKWELFASLAQSKCSQECQGRTSEYSSAAGRWYVADGVVGHQ